MKKVLIFLFSLLIGIGLFIWIIKFVGWQEIKQAFLVFTGWQGLVILALTVLMIIFGIWRWKEILKSQGHNIPSISLTGPYLSWFSLSYLTPMIFWGADVFRGYVLKERNSVSWSKGMASVITDRILEWTVNLAVIFFGVLIFLLMIGLPPRNLLILFGGVFLFFLFGISFFYFKTIKRESMAKIILRSFSLKNLNHTNSILEIEKEIFNFFKPQKISMWKALAISFLRTVAMYFRAWLLILFLGKEISALSALSILNFTYLAVMIPIPAALGSHEAIQTFAFNSLGLGLPTATAFTMIIRGAELIIALAGIVILFQLGVSLLRKALLKKINNFANKNEV